MNKSKILAVAMTAALVSSVAAISVNAAGITKVEDIKDHKVGITGSFCGWGNGGEADIAMTDDDGDGKYTGSFTVTTTEDMVGEATGDDGTGQQVGRGITGVTFKVRLDGSWDDSWGEFEPSYERTYNSQTNCCAECAVGDTITVNVTFDTTKNSDEAVKNGSVEADDDVMFEFLPVTYTVEKGAAEEESKEEEKKEEESKEEVKEETPAVEESEDTSTPKTGDTTSTVALMAVVLASLGVAVVMTKKATSKN